MKPGRIDHWVDRGFWLLLTAVAGYASTQIENMSNSINDLNAKLSTYIERTNNQGRRMDQDESTLTDHEKRIRHIESYRK